jgi:hypothetical protein
MDVGSFVQENKRWLLGCGIGLAVFFIARGVIGSIYDPTADRLAARRYATAAQSTPSYDRAALEAANKEHAQLQAERQRLEAELGYVQDAAFKFEGKGLSPDEFLGKVGRERKLEILRAANERDVQVADRDITFPAAPQGVDEIRSALFGIELVDAVCRRLFDAHDAVHKQDPQAEGLSSMRVGVEAKRTTRRLAMRPGHSSQPDLGDLFDQERVKFEFHSDEATMQYFLESLRKPGKALTLENGLKASHSGKRGDPLTVTGYVVGIALKESN